MDTDYTNWDGAITQIPGFVDALKSGDFLPYIGKLQERASGGDSEAAIALGHVYSRGGRGVPRDYNVARYWWQQVKPEYDMTGLVSSQLGGVYYKGLGVPKDRAKAYSYFRRAASHGHRKSLLLIAILNKKGYGALRKPRTAEIILRATVSDSKTGLWLRFLALLWLY